MIAQALKDKWTELRKNKDDLAKFLSLIQSNANELAKKVNPTAPVVSDEHALQAIKAGVKKAEETIAMALAKDPNADLTSVRAEIDLLNSLLPTQASEDDIRAAATSYIQGQEAAGVAKSLKLMGPTIKALEDRFGVAALNRGTASAIVKSLLQG